MTQLLFLPTMNLRILPLIAAPCLLQGAHAEVPDAISYQGRALTAIPSN